MRNNKLTVIRKLRILEEAENCGNIRGTVRKYCVSSFEIRTWRKNYEKIKEQAEVSPTKLMLNKGAPVENTDLEATLAD